MRPAAFLSLRWQALARARLQALLEADPEGAPARLCVVERFRNPPRQAPLSDGGHCMLRIEISRGKATLRFPADTGEDADLRIDCEWDDAHRAACLMGEDYARFNAWRQAHGRLSVSGSVGSAAPLFAAVHEYLAPLTLPANPDSQGRTQ